MNAKALLTALVLASAVVTAQPAIAKVSVVQIPSPALAKGSAYAWAPGNGVAVGSPAPAIVNDITAEQFRAAADAALGAKGYRRVDNPADADLIVMYGVMTAVRLEGSLNGWGGPGAFFAGASDYSLNTSPKLEATLVLDLVEQRSGRLVYRATSEKDVTSRDVEAGRLAALLKDMTKPLQQP